MKKYPLKISRRFLTIAKFSLSNILLPLYSVLISLLVIRFCGKNLWGEFVKIFLIVNVSSYFLSCGNKEFLIRQFSISPAAIMELWRESLVTRFLLFVIIIPVLLSMNIMHGYEATVISWVIVKFFYMSYDSRIVYRKKFIDSIFAEASGFIFLITVVFIFKAQLALVELLNYFLVAEIIKLVVIFILSREKKFTGNPLPLNLNYFKSAFPFFILTFSSLLQSRADQFCVNSYLTSGEAAEYQVFMNFLLYAIAIPGYIMIPYLKTFYRLKDQYLEKLSKDFFLSALLLVPIVMTIIYFVMHFIYRFQPDLKLFVYGTLFTWPVFYYTPVIYLCFKLNMQITVVRVILCGLFLNMGLCLLLVPEYRIHGAVLSAAISQWLMLFIFIVVQKRISKKH